MSDVHGARLEAAPDAASLVAWLVGGQASAEVEQCLASCAGPAGTVWILAHCHDGVTWGRATGTSASLSSGAIASFPTPTVSTRNLLQLRIFGHSGEVLVWRVEGSAEPAFSSRFLGDGKPDASAEGSSDPEERALASMDELRLVLGHKVIGRGEMNGTTFTVLSDSAGRTHAVPWKVTHEMTQGRRYVLGLEVRHYLARDGRTGVVRVAAGRLVQLRVLTQSDGRIGS